MNLARYTKALVPAVGSVMAVLYRWAETGQWDVPTLRLAAVGLAYAAVVFLLPNAPLPEPPPATEKPTPAPVDAPNEGYIAARLATDAGSQPAKRARK